MRTLGLPTFAVMAALIVGACDDAPAAGPNPPELVGVVAEVDSPETVDGGRLLGELKLTLADGAVLEVPRGVGYKGPRCVFVEEGGDYGTVRDVSECVVHIGMAEDVVDWILGFRIESDGSVTSGFSTGDLVEVNLAERYVVTRWGGTFPWRDDPPVFDCVPSGGFEIDDPALLDHATFLYHFDPDGYLSGLECGYEE